ncbi:hypothetical protein [Alicyclobacillus kakegawensis]|uniref:hypothetical protein n=1 Tax=Alicyclobacillus kakegawensis TaxID=392012 RepID=UPI0008313A6F|nr:hypothetical protein [Alicyclobacillus kakegawensis]
MSREDLHRLVNEIPDSELNAAQRFLEFLRDVDPVRKALAAAPVDDEPETAEEIEGVEEAEADIRAGRTMTTDELRRELGL